MITKPTNPKDMVADGKLPLHLVPDTLDVFAALAFLEGALKYGAYNWRVAGVRASVYRSALDRHIKKWWNGEWADPGTGVPHLANAIACLAILVDASVAGKLTDDRPPSINLAGLITGSEFDVKRIKERFEKDGVRHYTIDDTQEFGT